MTNIDKLLQRPRNFYHLTLERQWEIDKQLGILDLEITEAEMTFEAAERIREHFQDSGNFQ